VSTEPADLEQLRWQKFPVLDSGFVCLVDWMGSDASIVQAARVSYGKGTRTPSDDRTLIRYLMRHRHSTPFEMAEVKLLVRVPMDCWRQWIRHRTASINEYSTRYSEAIDESARAEPNAWRLQSTVNQQGSEGLLGNAWPEAVTPPPGAPATPGQYLTARQDALQAHAREVYQERLRFGVAREQARKDLPLSVYTQAYWKIDLHNLLHFLELRMDALAQQEIRQYAETIGREIVRPLFPLVWEAFEDYRLHALDLSRIEQEVIAKLAAAGKLPADEEAFLAAGDPSWRDLPRCRERDECRAKLARLGLLKG
jgi:thymidylate synthase (FAD)